MERSAIVPHMSWSGPQPDKETDAYLLAMLLRIYSSGLDFESEEERDAMLHPSVLTTENLSVIALMYAFYKERMEDAGARNTEDMLRLIKTVDEESITEWIPDHKDDISKAEAELLEFVESKSTPGFKCFG